VRERDFEVYGRKLSALSTGEPGQMPILALHGWLDNAASFVPLAQHMDGCELVALDLAGHGHSEHRGVDGEYNIWNDLPDILAVADALGWESFNLLGHSRGGIVSSLFASAMPERVRRLVLLDSYHARSVDPAEYSGQLLAYMRDKQRLLDKQSRVFADQSQAVALRAGKGLGQAASELLVLRNLRSCEGGWCWSTDARVQGASAFKLTAAHNAAIMAGLSMPTLVLLAEAGLSQYAAIKPAASAAVSVEIVPGAHHFHMEESVPELAARILEFFATQE
jgi:pimeloyl-ACP methyl ester carboxylesterase